MPNLVLFGTLGCHLCTEAEILLEQWFGSCLVITYIDIADSEHLVEQYGIRIPVVSNGVDELDWPFSQQCCEVLARATINAPEKVSGESNFGRQRRVLRISTKE